MSKNILKKLGLFAAAAVLAVGALAFASGCSQASDEPAAEPETPEATEATEPAAEAEAPEAAPAAEPVTVRVGYWGGTCEAPLYVAFENGYFEEQGINAEMTKITSGSAAFLADGGYCCFEATPNFLPMIINGLDVKFISSVHTGCLQAVATEASGITSINDLEGKKIGLFSEGGDPGEVFLKAAMTDAGLDYNKVEWIVEGNIGTILQELAAGNIDGFAYFDPYGEVAADYFGCVKFWSNGAGSAYENTTCCFLAANADIYNDPDVAARVAAAVDEASKWIQENPEEAAALIQDKGYVAESNDLLGAFGVDTTSVEAADIHEVLLKSYTFGDKGQEAFESSLADEWGIIEKAGMLPEGKTVEELCSLIGAYALAADAQMSLAA